MCSIALYLSKFLIVFMSFYRRFKSLENRVVEIHNMVTDILATVQRQKPLPNSFPSYSDANHASPSYSDTSPSLSAATAASNMMDTSQQHSPVEPYNRSISASIPNNSNYRQHSQSVHPMSPQQKTPISHDNRLLPSNSAYVGTGRQSLPLPRILTLQESNASRPGPSSVASMRYHIDEESPTLPQPDKRLADFASGHVSQGKIPSSNITSSSTSDAEDDNSNIGELPKKGMLAPWKVLRGLAEVASEMAAQACIIIYVIKNIRSPCITGKCIKL